VSIGNFRYTGGFRFDTTVTKEYRGEYPKEYELSPGDILLVMTCQTAGGEILGIPGKIPDDDRIYLHNQRMGKVVIHRPDLISEDFAYWIFLWKDFNQELVASSTGTKIVHTAPSRIEAFKFDLPPINEQRAIARIFNALDDKIELNRQTNQTMETLALALFKSWFIDFDPVIAKSAGGKPYGMNDATAALFPDRLVESELGLIPEGWCLQSVYDTAIFINGRAFNQNHFTDKSGALPIVKITELKNGINGQTKFSNHDFDKDYLLKTGDILFSWSGSPDTSIDTFIWANGDAWLNQHIFKVVPKSIGEEGFIYSLLKYLKPEFVAIASDKQTTGLGHVTIQDLKRLKLVKPPDSLVSGFSRVISPIFSRLISNSVESKMLASLRDLLLPKLLSGEIRIGQAEKALAEAV
jgi:type I restriction enzyme, S subunit